MSYLTQTGSAAPSTPATGKAAVFVDTTAKILCVKDDAGFIRARSSNAAITAQAGGFAADTYVTDSSLIIPAFGLQARTTFYWLVSASKTGAGTAQPVYTIRIGPNKTTADTARLVLTGPAQTAIADIGTLAIMLTVRSIGAAGVIQGSAWWMHRGTAASSVIGVGFANDGSGHVEATSGAIDMTALAGQYIGLSMNFGASAVVSPTQVQLDAVWG